MKTPYRPKSYDLLLSIGFMCPVSLLPGLVSINCTNTRLHLQCISRELSHSLLSGMMENFEGDEKRTDV